MYVTRRDFYQVLAPYLDANESPVHEVAVQGGTIMRIFRFEGESAKRRVFLELQAPMWTIWILEPVF